MLRTSEEVELKISQSLQNKTLIVTTRTGMPYMRIKQVINVFFSFSWNKMMTSSL